MSNQASEDDDIVLRRILFKWAEKFNEMGEPNEGQDGWYITYDKYMDSFTKEVQSLIRTEKLKLLAEVRERVIGENDRGTITNPDSPSYGEQYESAMADKDDLRAELNKLEAEL